SPRPEGSSYLRVNDDAPVVVSREVSDAILQTADHFRDKSSVPYLSLELQSFDVTHAKGSFGLVRRDEHTFLVQDRGVLASRDALEDVWGTLADMRADSFPAEADARRLTEHPRVTIVMTPKEGDKPVATILLGEACPSNPEDVVAVTRLAGSE